MTCTSVVQASSVVGESGGTTTKKKSSGTTDGLTSWLSSQHKNPTSSFQKYQCSSSSNAATSEQNQDIHFRQQSGNIRLDILASFPLKHTNSGRRGRRERVGKERGSASCSSPLMCMSVTGWKGPLVPASTSTPLAAPAHADMGESEEDRPREMRGRWGSGK